MSMQMLPLAEARSMAYIPPRSEFATNLMAAVVFGLGVLGLVFNGTDSVFSWGAVCVGLGTTAGLRTLWLRKNLLNSWYNALVTIVLAVVLVYLVFRGAVFVFQTGQWEAVRRNLTLLMIGTFPRDEQWRLIAQMYLLASAIGIAWGTAVAGSRDRAIDTGVEPEKDTLLGLFRRYWAMLALLAVILVFTGTVWPTLFTISCVAVGLILRQGVMLLPRSVRRFGGYTAAFVGIVSFQILTGTGGIAWWWMGGLFGVLVMQLFSNLEMTNPRVKTAIQLVAVVATVVAVYFIYRLIGNTSSVGWDDWAGLHLTLVASATAIIISFPFSLLLALGRRSSLPVVRWLSVGYIELIRGVPLITLLFMASLFIGFFLDTDTPLSLLTRATIALTLFSAAYLAEVVRGGLQAVSRGQVEAGQSVGLQPFGVMRLIVLPQALRAVIPAFVGQLISLFKDSSLLSIISLVELVRAREIIHAQDDFLVATHAETLVFVGFAYWAISYTMSRESQRFERRLGIGVR